MGSSWADETPAGRGSSSVAAAWRGLGRRVRWLVAVCVFTGLVSFGTQLAEIPWRSALRGYDNSFNYFWLRSLMVGGDWDFRDDLAACDTLAPEDLAEASAQPLTPAGRTPNKYGVGWALVSLPFYLVADGVVAAGRAGGLWSYARDGYNPVYQVVLQTGHLLLAGAALLLAYRVARRWCGRDAAATGVAMLWAASPLLYYQTSNLSMSHGVTFFALALCLHGLLCAREQPGRLRFWVMAGAGLGLAIITRFQTAIYGLLPLWVWLASARAAENPVRTLAKTGLALAAGAVPLLALQVVAWKEVYGVWLIFSYGAGGEGFNWTQPEVLKVLFSPFHGVFYWHPWLLAGVAGLVWLAWRKRGLAAIGVVVVGLTIYVNAAWWCWWFGASFGGRAFEGTFLFLMAGLAWAHERLSRRASRRLFYAGAGFVALNIGLLVLYRTATIPRNEPVTWFDALRSVPHLPAHLPEYLALKRSR